MPPDPAACQSCDARHQNLVARRDALDAATPPDAACPVAGVALTVIPTEVSDCPAPFAQKILVPDED